MKEISLERLNLQKKELQSRIARTQRTYDLLESEEFSNNPKYPRFRLDVANPLEGIENLTRIGQARKIIREKVLPDRITRLSQIDQEIETIEVRVDLQKAKDLREQISHQIEEGLLGKHHLDWVDGHIRQLEEKIIKTPDDSSKESQSAPTQISIARGRLDFQSPGSKVYEPENAPVTLPVSESGKIRIRSAVQEAIQFPNGDKIEFSGDYTIKLVNILLQSSEQNPLSLEDIISQLYKWDFEHGESIKVLRSRFSALLSKIRDRLDTAGYEVVNTLSYKERHLGQKGKYYLSSLDEPTPPSDPSESKLPVEEKKPTKKDQVISVLNNATPENPVTTSQLIALLYPDANIPKAKLINRINAFLPEIRKFLAKEGLEVVNITTTEERFKGRESRYYLKNRGDERHPSEPQLSLLPEEETPVLVQEDTANIKKKLSGEDIKIEGTCIIMPNGRRYNFKKSPKRLKIIQRLLNATEDSPISGIELAKALYGENVDPHLGLKQLSDMLSTIREDFEESTGYRIETQRVGGLKKGESADYFLVNTDELEHVPQPQNLPADSIQPEGSSYPPLPRTTFAASDVIRIDYEPDREAVRSELESKVLDILTRQLDLGEIHWWDIQTNLGMVLKREKLDGEKVKIHTLTPDELKEMFKKAIQKIQDESQVPRLKEQWSKEDEKVFARLEKIIKTCGHGDVNRLLRVFAGKLRKELDEIKKHRSDFDPYHPLIIDEGRLRRVANGK